MRRFDGTVLWLLRTSEGPARMSELKQRGRQECRLDPALVEAAVDRLIARDLAQGLIVRPAKLSPYSLFAPTLSGMQADLA